MIKTFLLAIHIFAVFLFAFFQKGEVSITHDAPASLKPGTEQVVTVQIDKSAVIGFAKFQVTVDPGMTIEAIETAGASFTFNEQKAKFIWMALPAARKFELKYRLIASESAAGSGKLDNRFSYVSENERVNFDLPTHTVSFGIGETAPMADETKPALDIPLFLKGERTITNAGINQWRIDVSITKTGLEGFAKLEEEIPPGYTAIDLKSSNAVFSVEDTSIKYLWYDFPDKETVVVSYKLLPVVAMDGEEPLIKGEFVYLKDGKTETLEIGKTYSEPVFAQRDTVPAQGNDQAAMLAEAAIEEEPNVTEMPATEGVNTKVEESIEAPLAALPDEPKTPAAVVVPIAVVKSEAKPAVPKATTPPAPPTAKPVSPTANPDLVAKANTDGNIVNVPQPEKGVFYRVQIAAGPNNLNREQFAKLYLFTEDLKLETQSGLLKYTTGYHQVYKSARDARVRITEKYNKFRGPFVTAYNDGERITVQEALMITNQKWFQ